MRIKSFTRHWNESGMGLIAVLVAAAILAITIYGVSQFIVGVNKQSIRLASSSMCQSVISSTSEFFKKDEATLRILSNGPDNVSHQFTNISAKTSDGLSMYQFKNGGILAWGGTSPMTVSSGEVASPSSIQFNNYFNIANTLNRLILLAADGHCCKDGSCSDFETDSDNSYDYYLSGGSNNPGGLEFGNDFSQGGRKLRIKLAVDILEDGSSLCSGTSLSRIPDIKKKIEARYKFSALLDEGEDRRSYCTAEGLSDMQEDTSAPITILSIRSPLCDQAPGGPTKTGAPSICRNNNNTVSLEVRTFNKTPACENYLNSTPLQRLCGAGAPLDVFSTANPGGCQPSDPGSIFLCRIGEQNWFLGAGRDQWEPCDSAKVYDHSGNATVAKVSIQYNRPTNSLLGDSYTRAQITIEDAPTMAYMVDVRAVDTRGNKLGPSFCSYSPTCRAGTTTPVPTFVVDLIRPKFLSKPLSQGGFVDRLQAALPTGISATMPNLARSQFLQFSMYQCNGVPANDGSEFRAGVTYNLPVGTAPLLLDGVCSGRLKKDGAIIRAMTPVSGVTQDTCVAKSGAMATDASGAYTVEMDFENDCGWHADTNTESDPWCFDRDAGYSVTVGQGAFSAAGVAPTFDMSTSKKCGLVYGVPGLSNTAPNGFVEFLTSTSFGISGWNSKQNSGCLASPSSNPNDQFCSVVYDPCGRVFNAKTTYSTRLDHTITTNECKAINANQVGGNICALGADWCSGSSSNYNCISTNTNVGKPCSTADGAYPGNSKYNLCGHPSDCGGQTLLANASSTQCAGDRYKCVSTKYPSVSVSTNTREIVGNACVVRLALNSCQGTGNSGTCSLAGTPCNPSNGGSDCPKNFSGTWQVDVAGSCVAPSSKSCNACLGDRTQGPYSGREKYCPTASSCGGGIINTQGNNYSCAGTTYTIPPDPSNCTVSWGACMPKTDCPARSNTGETRPGRQMAICSGPTCGPACDLAGWRDSPTDCVCAIPGECGSSQGQYYINAPTDIPQLCSSGAPSASGGRAVSKVGNNWEWVCGSFGGGSPSSTCSAHVVACKSGSNDYRTIPTSLCTSTKPPASSVQELGDNPLQNGVQYWKQDCEGSDGTVTCYGDKTIDGVCKVHGNLDNLPAVGNFCEAGWASGLTSVKEGDVVTGWTWECNGYHGGTDNTCTANKKVDGVCGADNGQQLISTPTSLCHAATPTPIPATPTYNNATDTWSWSCQGINGGGNTPCSATKSNSCDSDQPSCAGSSCFLTYDPTQPDQAWVKDAGSCGFSCTNGYTGSDCETPPSCSSSEPACSSTSPQTCSLTPGSPTESNQAWVKGASSCGFSCETGYEGANCQTATVKNCASPNPPCGSSSTCRLDFGATTDGQAWVQNASSCGYTYYTCSSSKPACSTTSPPTCSLTSGSPTSANQAWVKGASSCGFSCTNGYTGSLCDTPIPSCSSSEPACKALGRCSLTPGSPTSANQAWVKGASSCGFSCTNGYAGSLCDTPIPDACSGILGCCARVCSGCPGSSGPGGCGAGPNGGCESYGLGGNPNPVQICQ